MRMLNGTRFRVLSLVLVGVAFWSVATGRPPLHARDFWVAVAFAGVWALTLVGSHGVRSAYATVVGFVASVVATLLYPSLGTLLLVSIGWVGARLSWRALKVLGLPIVLFAGLVLAGAGRIGRMSLHAWLGLVASHAFLNLLVTFGVVMLLGRFAAENIEIHAAQAQALAELQAAHEALQRQAANAEELAILKERSRLSRELHDTLGHALSAITMQMEAVRRVMARDPEQAQALLTEAQDAARAAMQDLRQHLSTLREPAVPEDVAGALRELGEQEAIRHGWTPSFDLAPVILPPPARRALLQVAREALENAGRHASARHLSVSLQERAGQIHLCVADDGRGFDPSTVPRDHFGLKGMRERVRELGGELVIDSAPGAGTRVAVRLPQNEREEGGVAVGASDPSAHR
jgi:signal transduction histidine kinase